MAIFTICNNTCDLCKVIAVRVICLTPQQVLSLKKLGPFFHYDCLDIIL